MTVLNLVSRAREVSSWNDFAASLVAQFDSRGSLSARQVDSLTNMFSRMDAKKAEADKKSGDCDLSRIHDMFKKATSSGLKKPKFRTPDISLSLAGANSRNAGSIYVNGNDGEYYGKVTNDKFYATSTAPTGIIEKLLEISLNPFNVAVHYGRVTGQCGCCGRKLTNKKSIELGIGPICAIKWGI